MNHESRITQTSGESMKTIRERMNPRQELSETYERNGLPDEDH